MRQLLCGRLGSEQLCLHVSGCQITTGIRPESTGQEYREQKELKLAKPSRDGILHSATLLFEYYWDFRVLDACI